MADLILGHDPIAAVEWDPYCCQVLRERAAEGWFPGLQVFEGDIRSFDGTAWAGRVDIVAGGFPCTDISIVGKGAGIEGDESGLWREMARVVRQVGPKFVFVENSPMLTHRGLGKVLGDLAGMGFDAEWGVFSAHDVGASHLRKRMFILAHAAGVRWDGMEEIEKGRCPSIHSSCFEAWRVIQDHLRIPVATLFNNPVRDVVRNDDGLPEGMDRLKAIGNAQCPLQAALAFKILMGAFNEKV